MDNNQKSLVDYMINIAPQSLTKLPTSNRDSIQNTVPNQLYDAQFFGGLGASESGKVLTPDTLEFGRENTAKNQTAWDLTKGVIDQTVMGELIGGTLESIGGLGKIVPRIMGEQDAFQRNFLENWGNDIREESRERNPIFQTNDARLMDSGAFLTDATFWTNMLPSTISTVSMMVPAMGISALARGLVNSLRLAKAATLGTELIETLAKSESLLGRAIKASIEGNDILKIANGQKIGMYDALKATDEIAKHSGKFSAAGWTTNVFVPALASRQMDSAREATGRLENLYNQYKELYSSDPDGGEARAKKSASEAVHNGYVYSFGNILFDVAEWSIFSKLKSLSLSEARLSEAIYRNPKFLQATAEGAVVDAESSKSAIKKTISGLESFKDKLRGTHIKELAKTGLFEGFDETAMDFFMNEGQRTVDKENHLSGDESSFVERVFKHHFGDGSLKNWESFIGGFIGGVGMSAGVLGKNAIQNKWFNKKGNAYIEHMADLVVSQNNDLQETVQRIQKLKSEGQHELALAEEHNLLANTLTKGAANGSLDYTIAMLDNISKLTDAQKKSLDWLSADDLQGNKHEFDLAGFSEKLKESSKIYNNEMYKIRTGTDNDRLIGLNIAHNKVLANLYGKEIERIKRENVGDFTEKTLDEATLENLKNIHEESVGYYEAYNTHNNNVAKLEFKKKTLENAALSIQQELERDKLRLGKLEDIKEKVTDKHALELIDNEIAGTNELIRSKELSIENINKINEETSSKIETEKSNFEDTKKTFNGLNSYKQQVETIAEADRSRKENFLTEAQSYVKSLEAIRDVNLTQLAKLETKEGQEEFIQQNDENRRQTNNIYKIAIKNKIDKATDSDEIDSIIDDFNKNFSADNSILTELTDYAKNRKRTLQNKEDEDERIRQSSRPSEEADKEPTTFAEKYEALKKQKRDELNSITTTKNKLGFKKVTAIDSITKAKDKYDSEEQAKRLIKEKYDSLMSELERTSDANEVLSYKTSKSHAPAPTGRNVNITNNKGESFTIGQSVTVNTKGSKGKQYTIHSYDSTTNMVKLESMDKNGKLIYRTINLNSIESIKTTSVINNGNKVTITPDMNAKEVVEEVILNHSSKIVFDETSHTYKLVTDNSSQMSTKSASSLLQTPYSDNKSKESNATVAGNIIDTMVRDFFSSKGIQSKDNYNISQKAYSNIVNYLNYLQVYFDSKGYRVLVTNYNAQSISNRNKNADIMVFDEDTGIAGAIDMALIDDNGDVIIIDTKTKLNGTGATYFSNDKKGHNSFNSHVVQLNIYAKLFEKAMGIKVSKLGILPINVVYKRINDVSNTHIDNANSMEVTEGDMLLASNQNRNISDKNSIGKPVTYDNTLIMFDVNEDVLDSPSTVEGKTIREIMRLDNENDIEINDENIIKVYDDILNEISNLKNRNNSEVLNDLYNLYSKTFIKVNNKLYLNPLAEELLNSRNGLFSGLLSDFLNKNELALKPFLKSLKIYSQLSETANINLLDFAYIRGRNMLSITYSANKPSNELDIVPENVQRVSQSVINLANSILNDVITGTDSYFLNYTNKISLIHNLIQLKRMTDLTTNVTLTIEDVYRLLKQAHYNIDSDIDIDSFMPLLLDIPNIVSSIKSDMKSSKEKVLNDEKLLIKTMGKQDSIFWDTTLEKFYTVDENGEKEYLEDWIGVSLQSQYEMFKGIDDTLHIEQTTKTSKGQIITTRKDYNRDIINSIIESYTPSQSINNQFSVEINQEFREHFNKKDGSYTDTGLYKILNNILSDNNIQLSMDDKGNILVHYMENGNAIKLGTIFNIGDTHKLLNIVRNDNGNVTYVGFKDLRNRTSVRTTLEKVTADNRNVLEILAEAHKNRLLKDANNRDSKSVSEASRQYKEFIRSFSSNTNSVIEDVKAALDNFIVPGTSNADAYSEDNINKILDMLFFGTHLNTMENYKPSVEDVGNRLGYFDSIQKNNFNKYNILKRSLEKTKSKKQNGTITNISKPSVLIDNTKKDGKLLRRNLLDIIAPTRITTNINEKAKVNIIHKRNSNIVDFRTGKSLEKETLEKLNGIESKSNGIYVVLKSPGNKLIAFPLRQNVLSESYKEVTDENGMTRDLSEKAINHVANVIQNLLFVSDEEISTNTNNVPVGARLKALDVDFTTLDDATRNTIVKNTRTNMNTIADVSGIRNMIIVKGSQSDDVLSYPYFDYFAGLSSSGRSVDKVVYFTTVEKDVTKYHKIVIKDNVLKYFVVESVDKNSNHYSSKSEEFAAKLYDLKSNTTGQSIEKREDGKTSEVKKQVLTPIKEIDLTSSDAEQQLSDILNGSKNSNSILGGLLRQSRYNKDTNQAYFGEDVDGKQNTSFVDPITNKEYSLDKTVDYLLETGAMYNNIGVVFDNNNKPISNVDIFGSSSLRFNVDVDNVTTMGYGKINNPIDMVSLEYQNAESPYVEVLDNISVIDKELSKQVSKHKSDLKLMSSYTGDAGGKFYINISYQIIKSANRKILNFNFTYTDEFLSNMYEGLKDNKSEKAKVNQVIPLILHEHIHKLLLGISEISSLSNEQKLQVIKHNNDSIRTFIESFKKTYVSTFNDGNTISEKGKEISKILGLSNSSKVIEAFIKRVEEDLNKSENKYSEYINEGKGAIGDTMAQELYTYMSNPYILKILSLFESDMNYEKQTKGGFINNLIDTLISIYNKMLEFLGISSEINNGEGTYLRNAKDMLSDLYNGLANGEVKETKTTPTKPTETGNSTEETTSENNDDLSQFDINLFGSNESNEWESNNLLIFDNELQDSIYTDDNNLPIC